MYGSSVGNYILETELELMQSTEFRPRVPVKELEKAGAEKKLAILFNMTTLQQSKEHTTAFLK